MGNTERKARKRGGEQFVRPAKIPTPREERAAYQTKVNRRAIKMINKALKEQRNQS